MTTAATTTEHDVIRQWVNSRGGWPSKVKGISDRAAESGIDGILRIDFPGYTGKDTLERISWDEFFQIFEEKQLALLFQEKLENGEESRFCRIVNR